MTTLDALRPTSATRPDDALHDLQLHYEVERFNTAYCAALDEGRLADWAEMFTADAFYVVTSRENHDANMPVGLIYCETRGMIRDRAFAISKTAMFAPRYLRHMVSNLDVAEQPGGTIQARANYMVLQVLFDRPDATIHQVGRYLDVFHRVDGALRLAERRCVYDNLLVPNALCLPV